MKTGVFHLQMNEKSTASSTGTRTHCLGECYSIGRPVSYTHLDVYKRQDLNRALRDDDGDIYDIIAGDFLVVGLGEDDFCSLSPELMKPVSYTHLNDDLHCNLQPGDRLCCAA